MSDCQTVIRAMEPEDLDFLYSVENDREVWGVGNASVPYSRYVLHDYIANTSNDIYHDGQVRLILENGDGETIGMVDLVSFSAQHCRAEVSIVIHRDYRRHGYAADALRQVADYSLRTLHLHQLYAIIAEDNVASLSLFEKQGFRSSGLLKDWLFDGKKYIDAVVLCKIL